MTRANASSQGDELKVEIVDRFRQKYPVDVYGMAEALGLKVFSAILPEDVSGKIEDRGPAGCVVTVNALHSPVRQRFTVAHEIAHFVLHRDLIGDGIIDNALYRDGRIGDERERQANRYAAALLMPMPLVRRAWQAGSYTPGELAADFGVSEAVAEIRMRELGCVLWPR